MGSENDIDTDPAVEALADAETRLAEAYGLLKRMARRSRFVPGSPAEEARTLLASHGVDWRADDGSPA